MCLSKHTLRVAKTQFHVFGNNVIVKTQIFDFGYPGVCQNTHYVLPKHKIHVFGNNVIVKQKFDLSFLYCLDN